MGESNKEWRRVVSMVAVAMVEVVAKVEDIVRRWKLGF